MSEHLVSRFRLSRVLNQDRGGLRLALYGVISDNPAVLLLERAAFEPASAPSFAGALSNVKTLGENDIYRWYMASLSSEHPDVKANLIYPCTDAHVKKYSKQSVRAVTETSQIYKDHVRPYIEKKRAGKLDWVYNIIEGRAEQEDILYREHGDEGFLLSPDLNWDRKTMTSLHLLGIVERRDIWSLRDLKRKHIPWLKHIQEHLLSATIKMYPELEADQLKTYVHYQPTYYHFHIHVVHVELEAGITQAVGKALSLPNIISQLEALSSQSDEAGMADVSLTYSIGEASDLWTEVFLPLKQGTSTAK